MLAYVFWHWPQPQIDTSEYEARLCRFHDALAEAPPDGFHGSWSFALRGARWANDGGSAYEDWYLLGGSADLDRLNDAAVSGARQAPHDGAAAAAAGGTAGLYRLRHGQPLRRPGAARWFAKPSTLSYAALDELVRPLVERTGGALWGRQMTLGPALEFCLHTATPCELPPELAALAVPVRTVFPRDAR
ncbi:MAG TPA: hypothetical protein VF178_11505 [Gemmatimonadaceae bacterium]